MASYFPMVKNSAQRIVFPILDADGDPVTGAASDTPDSEYSLDGASFVDCNDEIHEIATTSGVYYLDLLAGETNGDVVAIQVKTATAGTKTTVLVFYTSTQSLDTIDTNVDTLLTRLTATRAAYLDYLFSIYFGLVSGVAQAQDGGATSITMAAASSAVNDFYKGQAIAVYTGTGAGQARAISAYDGGTNVATVTPAWATAPDSTSWYVVINVGSAVIEDWIDGGRLDLLLDAIKAVTDVESGVKATVNALNNLSAAQVNAEVVDTLGTDTLTELSSVPASTPTIKAAIMLLYQALRNKIDVTATAKEVHTDAGAVVATKTLSDDGTTYSETKMA